MTRTWRVAAREYLENTKTKGFWIGIIMFPVMLLIGSQVPQFLDKKATPTRHYIVVDRSGEYADLIRERVESRNRRRVFAEVVAFAQKQAVAAAEAGVAPVEAPEGTPDVDPNQALETLGVDTSKIQLTPGKPLSSATIQLIVDQLPDEIFEDGAGFDSLVRLLLANLPEGTPEFVPPRPRFREVPLPDGIVGSLPDEELERALRPYLTGEKKLTVDGEPKELFALAIVPADVEETRAGIRYWSKNLTEDAISAAVSSAVTEEVRRREYLSREVSIADVEAIQKIRVRAVSFDPKKAEGDEKVSMADTIRQWAPSGFVYLLWIAIFSTAQMLLNNMIEEKSNRVVEVLLSSVTPGELMRGKLLGVALLGLTMIGAWITSLIVILKWKASGEAEFMLNLLDVVLKAELLVPFVIYFILGYLLYAAIFATIGSICNTIKDAQNFMGPVMLVLAVPMFLMMYIPKDPNGTVATIVSWIPLYTPFVMMNRAAADPPAVDLYGTMVLLVLTAVVMLWASGRIFRVGMLRTGQPPKILELIRWVTKPA